MRQSSKALNEPVQAQSALPTQILGVLLLALALLMAVSLLSHSPEDPPNSSRPPEMAQNLAGWFGAHLSYYLLFSVGYGAYALTLLVLLWGWNRFRLSDMRLLAMRSGVLLALVVIYCGATGVPSRGRTHLAWKLGGWLGVALSSSFLVPYLGRIGSYIFLGTLVLVLLMVATEIPFSRIPEWLGKAGRWGGAVFLAAWTWAVAQVRGWAQARAVAQNQVAIDRWVALEPETGDGAGEDAEDVDLACDEIDEDEPVFEDAIPIAEFEKRLEETEALVDKPVANAVSDVEIVEQAPVSAPPEPAPKKPKASKRPRPTPEQATYALPDLDLLEEPPKGDGKVDREMLLEGAQVLEQSLNSFNINGKVVQVNPGPVITTFEVEPPPGVKVNRIVSLADDLALVMKARSIRIQAPIPGKAAVGIEVPNAEPSVVYLKEIFGSRAFQKADSKLMLGLGKTASGEPYCADLGKMPHLLIAGATGAGKSVCINALIASILFRCTPEEVRFIMVDPKMVELSIYNDIPHLLAPVVTDPRMASGALKWAVSEMEGRYRTMAQFHARNIGDFNKRIDALRGEDASADSPDRMSSIIVVIDELADVMMTAPADIEDSLARLAQMARAVGIHLILATQRPSVNVITGTIKANFPTRIAFRVSSKVDSRTIIDGNGAEKLLGYGDMLFLPPGRPEPLRIHGAYISTEEIEQIVAWVSKQNAALESIEFGAETGDIAISESGRDERFNEALRLVVTHQQGSASLLQRRMKVGYNRAARLVDELEAAGILGASDGSGKAREVLVDERYLEQFEE